MAGYVPGTIWTNRVDRPKPVETLPAMLTDTFDSLTLDPKIVEQAKKVVIAHGGEDLLEYLFDG